MLTSYDSFWLLNGFCPQIPTFLKAVHVDPEPSLVVPGKGKVLNRKVIPRFKNNLWSLSEDEKYFNPKLAPFQSKKGSIYRISSIFEEHIFRITVTLVTLLDII